MELFSRVPAGRTCLAALASSLGPSSSPTKLRAASANPMLPPRKSPTGNEQGSWADCSHTKPRSRFGSRTRPEPDPEPDPEVPEGDGAKVCDRGQRSGWCLGQTSRTRWEVKMRSFGPGNIQPEAALYPLSLTPPLISSAHPAAIP